MDCKWRWTCTPKFVMGGRVSARFRCWQAPLFSVNCVCLDSSCSASTRWSSRFSCTWSRLTTSVLPSWCRPSGGSSTRYLISIVTPLATNILVTCMVTTIWQWHILQKLFVLPMATHPERGLAMHCEADLLGKDLIKNATCLDDMDGRPGLKAETHLAVCVRHNPRMHRSNQCFHYVLCTFCVLRRVIRKKKNRNWFNFSAYHVFSVFFCDAKYAHKTQTQMQVAWCDSSLRLRAAPFASNLRGPAEGGGVVQAFDTGSLSHTAAVVLVVAVQAGPFKLF